MMMHDDYERYFARTEASTQVSDPETSGKDKRRHKVTHPISREDMT